MKKAPIIQLLSLCFSMNIVHAGIELQNVQIGGFFSNGYIETSRYNYLADSEGGTTAFAEMGLNASWTLRDRTTVNGQLFAFELGPYGNYDPLIDYLFLDYNVRREFGIRAGRIKRELGVYNHVQDIDLSRTSVLLPLGLYDQRYRDISASLDGVTIYGNVDFINSGDLDYNFYAGFVDLTADGGVAGLALTSTSRIFDNVAMEYVDSKYNYGGQVWISPGVEGLRVGIGLSSLLDMSLGMTGQVPAWSPNPYLAGQPFTSELTELDMTMSRLSFEYYLGDWNFVGEYGITDTRYISESSIGPFPPSIELKHTKGDAWYLSGARRFGRLEVGATYTEYYADVDDRNGVGTQFPSTAYNKDLQFSVRYDVTDNWTLKAEIHEINGTSRLFNELQQNPVLDEESWSMFAAKSTFFF